MTTNWAGIGYITALGISTTLALCLAAAAWARRAQPGAAMLSLLALLTAIWAGSSALEPVATTLQGKEFWVNVQYCGYCYIPVVFLVLVLQHAGLHRWLARPRVFLFLLLPTAAFVAAWTNAAHQLMRHRLFFEPSGGLVFLGKSYGPLAWVLLLHSLMLLTTGYVVLLWTSRRAAYLYRAQARLLLAVGIIPPLWGVLYVFHSPLSPRMDLTPAITGFSLILLGAAVLRLGLCGVVPVARDAAFESLGDGVLVLDEQDGILDLNRAAERELGIARNVALKHPLAAVSPKLREALAGSDEPAWDAERRWQIRVAPLRGASEHLSGRVAMLADISREVDAAEERARLVMRVGEARRVGGLSALAGGVAHRLNNLLAAVLAQSGLAAMRLPQNSPARAHLQRLDDAAQRAGEFVGQILAYSGQGRFVTRPLDLSLAADEAARLLESGLPERVSLRRDLAVGLPLIDADASQIQQAIVNLVTNAVEAIEGDGVITLATETRRLSQPLAPEADSGAVLPAGDYVALRVSDTGCGMDADTLRRIFDPFFTTKFTGRGLGLAAVHGIVRGHQGRILVQSHPGAGSTFTLLFPARVRLVETAAAAALRIAGNERE